MKQRQQQVSNLPDLEVLNEYFANTASKLSSNKMAEMQAKRILPENNDCSSKQKLQRLLKYYDTILVYGLAAKTNFKK